MNSPIEIQCEFCLEDIPEEASVCKYCQSNQNQRKQIVDVVVVYLQWGILVSTLLVFSLIFLDHILTDRSILNLSKPFDWIQIWIVLIFVILLVYLFYTRNYDIEKLKNEKNFLARFLRIVTFTFIISILINVLFYSLYIGKENATSFRSFVETQEHLTPCQIEIESEGKFGSSHLILVNENLYFFLGVWGKYYRLDSITLEDAYKRTGTSNLEDFRLVIRNRLFYYDQLFL